MRLSHRQNRSILRVAHCLGAVSCLLALIYELLTQRTVPYILTDIVSLPIVGAVIYLLFARRRLYRRLAYGIFFAMCFVNGLFLLCYIYECATMVSAIHEKLINHIEHKAPAPPHVSAIISISKCCAIDDEKHTAENFAVFQTEYPDTCGAIKFNEAISCIKFVQSERKVALFARLLAMLLRIAVLLLLWKYLKDEYAEDLNVAGVNGERSTTTTVA